MIANPILTFAGVLVLLGIILHIRARSGPQQSLGGALVVIGACVMAIGGLAKAVGI